MQESKNHLQQRDKDKKRASTPLLKSFISFIPQDLVRKILQNPNIKIIETSEWIEGAILFSDISGFTNMSKSLSNYGLRGTEMMGKILNTYLSKMSELIYKHEGIIQKIAGDALTVFFEKNTNVQWKISILKAIECSFNMQKLMNSFRRIKTIAGEFDLTMKIGISSGRLFSGVLGSYDFGIEPFLIGKAIDLAVGAEHQASPGEIWIEEESFKRVENYIKVIRHKDKYYRIAHRLVNEPPAKKVEENKFSYKLTHEEKQTIINEISSCVPSPIAKRLELGYHEFLGEDRKTTILFINFEGLRMDDEDFEDKLRYYYNSMQKIITQYRGFLYEFESGDKGYKIIAVFGSPTSTEDNEGYAVQCANAIIQAGKDISWIKSQNIGITTGDVFAGLIGTPLLRRYALIGDKVNLAARLMSIAEDNTVLVDEVTYRLTRDRFVYEALPPKKIKGQEDLINTYIYKSIRSTEKKKTVKELSYMVGREEESKRFIQLYSEVANNNGQIVSVIGEMGMGKRSLIKAFTNMAEKDGIKPYEAVCYNYSRQIPYFGWIKIFNDITGIKDSDSNQDKLEKLRSTLNELVPQEVNKTPILANMLGIDMGENEWSKNLDPAVRKSNLIDLMSNVIINLSKKTVVFIILYDLHWSNSSTLDFLLFLSRNIKNERVMIVTSYRPFTDKPPEKLMELKKTDYHNTIVLNELNSEQTMEFIQNKWKIQQIPDSFKNIIKKNVGGNPYFIETLMTSLINTKQLLYNEEEGQYYFPKGKSEDIDIPNNMQNLIISQMDRLDETSKLLLKVSSVAGMNFNRQLIKWISPIKIDTNILEDKLSYLCEQGLLEREKKDGEIAYSFRNELTLETAYSTLPFSQRKHLHEATAETYEKIYNDRLDAYYEILAHHYSFTENIEKQLRYIKLAGKKARNAYANKESIEYFTQLSDIIEKKLKSLSDATSAYWENMIREAFDTAIELSDIKRFMGEMNQSKEWLEKAEDILVKITDEPRRYTLLRSFGEWFEFSDHYIQAMEYYLRAYKCISQQNDIEKTSLSAGHLGNLYRTIGVYEKALNHYKEAADLAKSVGDIMMRGRWLGNIGIIKSNQGEYDGALEYYFKALKISRDENDKSREAAWLSLIAEVYVARARYDEALKFGNKSLEVAEAIGYKRSIVMTLNTIGNTYRFLGKYSDALQAHQKALDIASLIGAINLEVICRGEIGEIYRFQQNWDEAMEFYKNAFSMAKSLGDRYNQALWERAIGIVLYQSPNSKVKKARQHLSNALELAKQIGHRKLRAEIEIHFGNAIAVDGELDEAERIIRNGLIMAQKIKHPGLSIWGKRMLGIILIKLGRKKEGAQELLDALKENEKLGLTKDIAECSLELGRELRDRSYLERALKLFKEIGLTKSMKQVEEFLTELD